MIRSTGAGYPESGLCPLLRDIQVQGFEMYVSLLIIAGELDYITFTDPFQLKL